MRPLVHKPELGSVLMPLSTLLVKVRNSSNVKKSVVLHIVLRLEKYLYFKEKQNRIKEMSVWLQLPVCITSGKLLSHSKCTLPLLRRGHVGFRWNTSPLRQTPWPHCLVIHPAQIVSTTFFNLTILKPSCAALHVITVTIFKAETCLMCSLLAVLHPKYCLAPESRK